MLVSISPSTSTPRLLVEPVSAAPIDVDRVYVQIESLLIKEGQDEARSVGVDDLLKKYTIIKNNRLLF